MNIDEVKGIKEAAANMREHYAFQINPVKYQVFYNTDRNRVDFTVESWGEEWLDWCILLWEGTKPARVTDIKRALKAKGVVA